jgi:hypothetical protein
MTTMRNELIAFAIISCILIAMILTIHPIDEITIKNFSGVFGVIGFVVVKKMVDVYYSKHSKFK